jgi:hypothetical protein
MIIRICKSKEKEEFEDAKMVIRICKSKEKEEFEDTKMIIRICKSKEKEEFEDTKILCLSLSVLLAIVFSVLLRFSASYYLFVYHCLFFWPLCSLSF